jgi:transposase
MKSASQCATTKVATNEPGGLPQRPPNGVTAGLDWASEDHAIAVVDDQGREVARATVEHTKLGIKTMLKFLAKHQILEVAIERGDGPVVDALLGAGVTVVVISPNQVKNLRSRYGSAGHKDDRFDAYVLADTLRTDRARLRPLTPDSPATRTLRATVRVRRDLVATRGATANPLRAHLTIARPCVCGLFGDLDSQTSLRFLTRFTTQDQVDWLTPARLAAWLSKNHYRGRREPAALHAHLAAAPDGLRDDQAEAMAHLTSAYVATLSTLKEQIKILDTQIATQFATHLDAPVFDSLPRSGTVRAARMLAEIGDARGKFPDAASLACLAGVAPATRQSGKHRAVGFRWAVNKELRDALCDFASDSVKANPWAAKTYNDARARGKDHAHAVRILARAWTLIIWRCWQTNTAYDPLQHNALQQLIRHPQAA